MAETQHAKKQLVRATLVLECPVSDVTSVVDAVGALEDARKALNGRNAAGDDVVGNGHIAYIRGTIELVKVSETGKQSRTKLGDVK